MGENRRVWFDILGPVEARRPDGTPVGLGGPQLRGLLALLAADAGRVVSPERLIDGLHGDHPPEGAADALQSQVSRLRRRLRDGGAPDGLVEFSPAGYRLAVDPETVDLHRFERLAAEGRAARDPARSLELLTEALDLWRGPALEGLPRAARLAELRLAATEDRIEAALALGRCEQLVPELRELTREHPLRERLSAQLMRALHGDGRQAEALAVFAETRQRLADELGADPSPELAETHLAILRHAEPAPANRVPTPLTGYVGRDAELARLAGLLTTARLVTLTGPGGAGKTRMAVEAARREKGDVCFVELSTSGDVTQAVLVALGLREPGLLTGGAAPDPGRRLVDGLVGRSLLLVLDNCEHVVVEAAQLVRRLLAGCPDLRVLATSREALALTGETVFPLGSLPPDAAARLFADRAAAVAPETVLEPDAVARVCQALDGLPLAIELAAARLRALTLDDVASRLDDRFRLLSRGDRTAEPRHRTLRGVVAWSWDLLEPEERRLARRFAVFSGGARLTAVERICGDDAEVLSGLVEKSLIEVADGRYRMLETIRVYCGEQLVEAGEEAELRAAHAEYFADLARAAEPKLRGGEQLDWLARLTAEHADLLAALRWSAVELPRLALRLLAALSWYWWLRGLRGEATPFADDVLAAIGPQPPEGLEEEYVLCLIHASATDVLIEPILLALGRPLRYPFLFLLWILSERPKGTDGTALAELVGPDPWAKAFSRIGDGLSALYGGQAELAEQHFTESLTGFRTLGDRWGEASALEKLAEFADRRGDLERFSALMDEAVRLVAELESAEDTADLLCRRADGVLRGGDIASARADYERAVVRARAAGAPVMLARAHGGLGEVARRSGDLAEARRWFELALDGCESASLSGGEIRAKLLTGLGWTAAAEGDQDAAAAFQQDALAVALDHGNLPSAAAAVEGLAGILAGRDEGVRAAFLLGVAVALRGSPISGDAEVAAIEATARARIGADGYVNAFDRGAKMAPDQAIEELGQRRSAIGS